MIPTQNVEPTTTRSSTDDDTTMALVNDNDENNYNNNTGADTTGSSDDIITMDVTTEETNSHNTVNSPRPDKTNSNVAASTTSISAPSAVTPYHHRSMTPSTTSSSSTSKAAISSEEPVVTTPLLSLYYQHLFPFDFLYQWFRYGTGTTAATPAATAATASANRHMNLFYHREFSFTIPNPNTAEEIYIRYQSFSHVQDFQRAIQKRLPIKIDIGAIFSHPPVQKSTLATSSHGATTSFQPIEREFVLDIDLTDYDDVRNCGCQAANICPICWKYMYMAMDTIQTALEDDFQFQHIQWFYSGRRGIHGWVCDAAARSLTDSGRTAVANYLTVRHFEWLPLAKIPFCLFPPLSIDAHNTTLILYIY